jgi:hypothetical protein
MPEVIGRELKYAEDDEHILRRLAGALIVQWSEVPVDLRKRLISQATLMGDRHETVPLRQQIESFIAEREE